MLAGAKLARSHIVATLALPLTRSLSDSGIYFYPLGASAAARRIRIFLFSDIVDFPF